VQEIQVLGAIWLSDMTRGLSTASLYIHWPYCKRKCTYCNFNKYVSEFVDHQRMRKCLVTELENLIKISGVKQISSIFFGGGTPSLAEPKTIESIVSRVQQLTHISPRAEISMEVNPTAVEINKLRDFKHAGINRVSIGIQTLEQNALKELGREHSSFDSLRCLEMAKKLFPDQVSVDLMFGWPNQTLEKWLKELREILNVCDKHISLYQLTLERGTQLFKQVKSNKVKLPDDETQADMYLKSLEILSESGFERYEVSNYAKECHYCQHNKSYWNGQQYIGIGPGAHGRFKPQDKPLREERVQTPSPLHWMQEVETYGHATRRAKPLTITQQLEELIISGLRTKWGVTNEMWNSISSTSSLEETFSEYPAVKLYIQRNLLELDHLGFRTTDQGMNILDSLLPDLILALEQQNSVIESENSFKR